MWKLEVTSDETIKPSTPTPPHLRTYKLSWTDRIIYLDHIPIVLFYPQSNSDSLSILKASLSRTLAIFYPFAGELDPGRASVECNDRGAHFLEAVAVSDAPLSRLIDPPLDFGTMKSLLPYSHELMRSSNYPLLSVQATTFSSCGGMTVGIRLSHVLADGHSAVSFVDAWARATSDRLPVPHSLPVFDLVSVLKQPPESWSPRAPPRDAQTLLHVTKRFLFEEPSIARLRESRPSTTRVTAVIALVWRCCMRARASERQEKPSAAAIMVNMRGKGLPQQHLPENQFGNLVQLAFAALATAAGTTKTTSEQKVRTAIRGAADEESVRRYREEDGWNLATERFAEVSKECDGDVEDVYYFTSWVRFPVYEADFGWGRPIWVGVDLNVRKNVVVLMGRGGAGGIEAWVTLEESDMRRFECDDEEIAAFASSV